MFSNMPEAEHCSSKIVDFTILDVVEMVEKNENEQSHKKRLDKFFRYLLEIIPICLYFMNQSSFGCTNHFRVDTPFRGGVRYLEYFRVTWAKLLSPTGFVP